MVAVAKPDLSEDPIVSIEVFAIAPRWVLVKVCTESGLFGWGEITVEGQPETQKGAIKDAMWFFIGKDSKQIRRWVKGYESAVFYNDSVNVNSALAGIEIALWDIAGKRCGLPIYRLLFGGEVRDKIKTYRWVGGNDPRAKKAAAEARAAVDEGWTALKFNASPPAGPLDLYGSVRKAKKCLKAIRKAVGPKIDIMVDGHGRWNYTTAREMIAALAPYKPRFIEEPVTPQFNRKLPELQRLAGGIPLATGERMTSPAAFADIAADGGVGVLQPDVIHIGGIMRLLEVGVIADANGLALAPHIPLSIISYYASYHAVATIPCGCILECAKGIHYNDEDDPIKDGLDPWLRVIKNHEIFQLDSTGHVSLPTGAGLGLEIDEMQVRALASYGTGWHDKVMMLENGQIVRW